MAKGNLLQDSFEQLVEMGQSTVKQGGKQIAQTFSPLKLIDQLAGNPSEQSSSTTKEQKNEKNPSSKNGSTPLNLDKLHQRYQDQEKVKLDALRNRLFQMVKSGEEQVLQRKKQEELQKKQKEAAEKEQRERQIKQQQLAQQMTEEPRGKVRRSIFSPKKIVQRQQAEVKPAAGKQ